MEPLIQTHLSSSVEQTESIAAALAGSLAPGACLALEGELGAGKTAFVRGLVRGLGGNPRAVSSPTFVLLNIYETPAMRVYHLDAYRVSGGEDFEAIGFTELLDDPEGPGLVAVEWPQRVSSIIPASCVRIRIETLDARQRRILIHRPPE
jgi:tRNA threonylcarbamoyladenosine biosynthesis protein TsaE